MSSDKAKKKIDKILEHVQERVGSEVGGLMGATLVMSDLSTRLISKGDFFDEPSGKLVFSEMQLSGEIEGDGCILVSVKDAIRLGGTLIMLPDNELKEMASSEEYSEEIDDSYGEIANIIAGAYTKTFEEMYPKKFRFIRKAQEIINPIKVDVESDKPIPNQNYYQVSSAMALNDIEMGNLILLIPAEPLGLDDVPSVPEQEATGPSTTKATVTDANTSAAATNDAGEVDAGGGATSQPEGASEGGQTATGTTTTEIGVAVNSFDTKKQKKRVDACLKECSVRMGEEVGALLGAEVTFTEHCTRIVNKGDFFFDEASGKQVLAHMDVVGDIEGQSYLYVGLRDAIFIGGTLIMLPPTELDNIVAAEEFNDDSEDAYGEIANIISGVYTKVFEEQYPDKIRFVKTSLEQVVPMKVDTDSEEPMPNVPYYMATSKINIGNKSLGNLQMLVPATLFKLDGLVEIEAADDAPLSDVKNSVTGKTSEPGDPDSIGIKNGSDAAKNLEYLIISNDGEECSKITAVLSDRGIAYKVLDYKESVSNYLPGNVKAVFLVMADVDEKGLGVAIKVSTTSSLPLVAVGPAWTRTKVIKAVKYGVNDILLTPASAADIEEKIDSVSAQMAA